MFKVLRQITSIGIEKSIDTSGIGEKVFGIVSKSIFTVSPTTAKEYTKITKIGKVQSHNVE